MPQAGELFHYPSYVFPDGSQRDKYVLLMGQTRGSDWILARTTSRAYGRPQEPRCHHGNPYPSFYLDTASGALPLASWLALDRLDDHDADEFRARVKAGQIQPVGAIPRALLCEALSCAASADDTRSAQKRAMKDLRADLGCP
jgi:hypothetical protein